MEISRSFANWFLNQLEFMSSDALADLLTRGRNGPWQALPRLFDTVLGEWEAQEIEALLHRPPGEVRPSTILLPGIMGSLLASTRGIGALLWFNPAVILNGQINLLDLNSDGSADRLPDVEITPVGIEKITYLPLILTLARETRLYEFPYDWRRHIEWNARALHAAIERWSAGDDRRRFSIVAHSMGGIVARAYMALYPKEAEAHIDRVVMLGTPLSGAPAAMLIFGGETGPSQIVSRLHPDNDVVRFAANLPSTYQLLPPPPELFVPQRDYPANWDVYRAADWGLPWVRQDYLDDGLRLHTTLAGAGTAVEVVEIAGCHQDTVTDVWCTGANLAGHDPPTHAFTMTSQDSGPDSGDELVPLWSTRIPGVQTYYVEECHHNLPSNPQVLTAVLDLVYGGAPALPQEVPVPQGLLQRLRSAPFVQQALDLRQRMEKGEFVREDLGSLSFAR